jgi:nitroreductase
MASLSLSVDELLTTTRTVRRRLDLRRDVPRSVVEECLELAFQAPVGHNAQDWGWVIIEDEEVRRRAADIYRRGFFALAEKYAVDSSGDDDGPAAAEPTPEMKRMFADSVYLADHMCDVPKLLVAVIGPMLGSTTTFEQATRWGSILQAVWSFHLALRSRGLGSAWTTSHLFFEDEMAELLHIPDGYAQAGMFPIAYTIGTEFRPADRSLTKSRIFWDGWAQRTT